MQARNTELLDRLGKAIGSEKGKAPLAAVLQARVPHIATTNKAIALGLVNKNDEARDVIMDEGRKSQTAFLEVIAGLVDFERDLM